jgi:hypothetical protein
LELELEFLELEAILFRIRHNYTYLQEFIDKINFILKTYVHRKNWAYEYRLYLNPYMDKLKICVKVYIHNPYHNEQKLFLLFSEGQSKKGYLYLWNYLQMMMMV